MANSQKIIEAIRRSLPHLAPETRQQVAALLSPASVAVTAGLLTAWAVSHAFAVGEIADLILLGIGAATLGLSVFSIAGELSAFFGTAINATTESELDTAGKHFAAVVSALGVAVLMALLTRGAGKSFKGRIERSSGPPPSTNGKWFYKPSTNFGPLKEKVLGSTNRYGDITIAPGIPGEMQRITIFHEQLHSFLSPRFYLMRHFRADLLSHSYERFVLLKYLEEAMAQSYGLMRVKGIRSLPSAIRFPIEGGYMHISEVHYAMSGVIIGTISAGGMTFIVYYISTSK